MKRMKEIIVAYDENTEASPVMGDWVGELVLCKDCKHGSIDQSGIKGVWCPAHAEWHDNNWFCADGVREDDD